MRMEEGAFTKCLEGTMEELNCFRERLYERLTELALALEDDQKAGRGGLEYLYFPCVLDGERVLVESVYVDKDGLLAETDNDCLYRVSDLAVSEIVELLYGLRSKLTRG